MVKGTVGMRRISAKGVTGARGRALRTSCTEPRQLQRSRRPTRRVSLPGRQVATVLTLCELMCPDVVLTVYRYDSRTVAVRVGVRSRHWRNRPADQVHVSAAPAPRVLGANGGFFHGKGAFGRQPGDCRGRHRGWSRGVLRLPHHSPDRTAEYMSASHARLGRTFLQAEREVASINMVYGAACGGARAMSSSSSPASA